MIFISKGLGGIVPWVGMFVFCLASILLGALPESWFKDNRAHTTFLLDSAITISCLCIYILGRKLNRPKEQIITEFNNQNSIHGIEQTRKPLEKRSKAPKQKPAHTFFFIKFEYWGIIFATIYFLLFGLSR